LPQKNVRPARIFAFWRFSDPSTCGRMGAEAVEIGVWRV
jgi:hypothetical protein